MSWLLVALIPGLLMLATFGLERLESGLNRDTVSAADVAEFLAQAEAADVKALARDGMGQALDRLHQRRHARDLMRNDAAVGAVRRDLPIPQYAAALHYRPNTEFQPTRHADRV